MSDEPTPLRLRPKPRPPEEPPTAASPPPASHSAPSDASASPLRLKPRLSTAGDQPAAAPPPESEPPAANPQSAIPPAEAPRIRLRPRLASDAALGSPASESAVEESTPGSPPPQALESPPVVIPASEPAAEGTSAPIDPAKFKLKPKSNEGSVPAVPVAPAFFLPADAEPPPIPPAPAPSPPPPPSAAPGGPAARSPSTVPSPSRRRPLLAVLALVALGAIAFFGYGFFSGEEAATAVVQSPPAPAAPASPSAPASTPGQTVARTNRAVESRASEVDTLLADDTGGLETRQASTPVLGNELPSAEADAAPAAPPAVVGPPAASAAFRQFASSMRINGVFQGTPARALINGRTVRAGETLDHGLGIVFVGVDVERRLILLRDSSGAEASKKY